MTCSPDWAEVPFQRSVICWSPGNAQVSVHGLIVPVPVLVSVTCAWKPPLQELTSEYTAEQDSAPGELDPVGEGDGEGEGEGEGDGDGDGDGDGEGEGEGEGEVVGEGDGDDETPGVPV